MFIIDNHINYNKHVRAVLQYIYVWLSAVKNDNGFLLLHIVYLVR